MVWGKDCKYRHQELFLTRPGTKIKIDGPPVIGDTISLCSSDAYHLEEIAPRKGIISLKNVTDHYEGNDRYEWQINLYPDDVDGFDFQLVSQLQNQPPPLTAVDPVIAKQYQEMVHTSLAGDVLGEKKQILPPNGRGIDLAFRLSDQPSIEPNGPFGYKYLSLSASISRCSAFVNGITPNPVTPFASSFPIYFLGNKITEFITEPSGGFNDNTLVLATIKTTDGTNNYTYKIQLVKTTRASHK